MENLNVVKKDMVNMSVEFPKLHQEYFADNCKEDALLELTTQPFWQSMRLSKKRLKDNGLTMETIISRDYKEQNQQDSGILMGRDGSYLIGNNVQRVVTKRRYLKDNKVIKSQKEYEISHLSMLQAQVDGEKAACPNCGYVSKLAEFMDGCNACGSQFTVNDFATKVSGFSLEENTWKKLRKTISKTTVLLVFLTVALVILGILSLSAVAVLLMSGQNGTSAVMSLLGFLFSVDMVPLAVRCLLSIPVIWLIANVVSTHWYKKRFQGEEKVKQVLENFSAEDFCQKLEYKLRNIHLTQEAKQVSAFATCSLEKIIPRYQQVVDCNVTRCLFEDIQTVQGGYRLKVQATMKLTSYTGKRIRTGYERLSLTLFGREEVVKQSVKALREYKCKNCNNSMNILEGSTCNYCDTIFDYADYDWVIEAYKIEKKPLNIFKMTRAMMIVGYLAVFLLHLVFVSGDTENDTWYSLYSEFSEAERLIKESYEQIAMPDDLDAQAELTDSHFDIISMRNVYKVEEAQELIKEYITVLEEDGFIQYEQDVQEGQYILYRPEVLDGEQGYFMMKVTAKENSVEVHIVATDTLEEEWK